MCFLLHSMNRQFKQKWLYLKSSVILKKGVKNNTKLLLKKRKKEDYTDGKCKKKIANKK